MSWQETFAGIRVNAQAGPNWPAVWAGVCVGVMEKRLRLIFASYGHDVRFRNQDREMLRAIRLSLVTFLFGELSRSGDEEEKIKSFKELTESEVSALFTFLDAPGSSEALAAWMEDMGWIWHVTS